MAKRHCATEHSCCVSTGQNVAKWHEATFGRQAEFALFIRHRNCVPYSGRQQRHATVPLDHDDGLWRARLGKVWEFISEQWRPALR